MKVEELDRFRKLFANYKLPEITESEDEAIDFIIEVLDAKLVSNILVLEETKNTLENGSRYISASLQFIKQNL